ncbi:MAG: biotin--[acetyl-CoA-carboxylase] ligase [Spirochaetota bacterium]
MKQLSIRNPFFSSPVYFKEKTSSTMDDARQMVHRHAPPGTVICTHYQTEGRGRTTNRNWVSPAGESLLCTLILDDGYLTHTVLGGIRSYFTLLAGLALAYTLEELFSLKPSLKWPNDILLKGKKVSGILCESEGVHLLTGIGVNCNQTDFSLKPGAWPACSIRQIIGRNVDPFEILEKLLSNIEKVLFLAAWLKEVEKRLYKSSQPVTLLSGHPSSGNTLRGTVSGLGENGELLFTPQGSDSLMVIISGEIGYSENFLTHGS